MSVRVAGDRPYSWGYRVRRPYKGVDSSSKVVGEGGVAEGVDVLLARCYDLAR